MGGKIFLCQALKLLASPQAEMDKMMVNRDDLIYTAGIMDGEGCIFIARHSDTESATGWYYELRIQVGMTDIIIPQWLKQTFGGYIHSRNDGNPRHKTMWIWAISCQKARNLLEAILPYMKVKRHQAQLGIEFQQMKANKRFHNTLKKPQWMWDKELAIMANISDINQGKHLKEED